MTSPRVENIIRAKEDEIRLQEYESAYVYDTDGNLLFGKEGDKAEVNFTTEELSLMRGAIVTHNHPSGWNYPNSDIRSFGNSFSPEDIRLASCYDLAEIRAVTPKLRFTMKPSQDGWSQIYWEEVLIPLLNETIATVHHNLFMNSASEEEATYRFWHEVWRRVARRAGLIYTREES